MQTLNCKKCESELLLVGNTLLGFKKYGCNKCNKTVNLWLADNYVLFYVFYCIGFVIFFLYKLISTLYKFTPPSLGFFIASSFFLFSIFVLFINSRKNGENIKIIEIEEDNEPINEIDFENGATLNLIKNESIIQVGFRDKDVIKYRIENGIIFTRYLECKYGDSVRILDGAVVLAEIKKEWSKEALWRTFVNYEDELSHFTNLASWKRENKWEWLLFVMINHREIFHANKIIRFSHEIAENTLYYSTEIFKLGEKYKLLIIEDKNGFMFNDNKNHALSPQEQHDFQSEINNLREKMKFSSYQNSKTSIRNLNHLLKKGHLNVQFEYNIGLQTQHKNIA